MLSQVGVLDTLTAAIVIVRDSKGKLISGGIAVESEVQKLPINRNFMSELLSEPTKNLTMVC